MSTFVSVGNARQPFDRLIHAVLGISTHLPQPVYFQYATSKISIRADEGVAYLKMEEFEQRVRTSKLLIMHAGAGSVIHAVRAGKVPVVMARSASLGEHVDDHQHEFAEQLASTGRIVHCKDVCGMLSAVKEAVGKQANRSEQPYVPELVALVAADLSRYFGSQR